MTRLIRSFGFAMEGIKACLQTEANMRIHFICSALVILFGVALDITAMEWIILLICIGFVICMEMFNTAIEQLCNEVTKDLRLSIKVIKDISAGAVLVSACIAGICGAIIFLPKLFSLIKISI